MRELRQFIDAKIYIILCLLVLPNNMLHSQDLAKVINVKTSYAVINKGSANGVKEGDVFKVQTPNRDFEYGQIEIIKAKSTISAVKLASSVSGYSLKIGDIVVLSEEQIVDELLNETPQKLSEQPFRLQNRKSKDTPFYGDRTQPRMDPNERMRIEMRLNGLKTRKLLDFIGLFMTFGITVVGDYAVGNDIFWGSPIPIIGPFINVAIIDESNSFEPSRDRLLFATSGVVQTFLFVDLLVNSIKINRLNRRIQFSYDPWSNRLNFALSF